MVLRKCLLQGLTKSVRGLTTSRGCPGNPCHVRLIIDFMLTWCLRSRRLCPQCSQQLFRPPWVRVGVVIDNADISGFGCALAGHLKPVGITRVIDG